ncbi:type I polyketide synthase [Chelatococcus reniformis]|uniref:Polyketide synthase n=1 Tax=Chelatococcus reniformis TaxID=1494448 RepID=A0A916X7W3_9HYPH|nr:type I polyketide synthase [Chelatococcus reniformis]GGC48558.1 polyketide synthase [Chelatococcus reniformis]
MSDVASDANTMERALRAIRDLRGKVASLEQRQDELIAIVGMGCRFPGASNLAAFWKLLVEGRDPLGPVPSDRWDIDALYSSDPLAPGKTVSREGGYLPGLDTFDAAFFGISPREAPFVDPRQRLILETAWEALEDAGIATDSLARSRTSVVIGTLTNDYNQLITADNRWVSASTGTGTSTSIIANRVSYLLDLRGPSLTVDTACSGSLMALHLAAQTLRNGEASLALCGGVAVNLVPAPDICFSRMGALSPRGRCRTFDAGSDGMTRSEGAGIVVLKRLAEAEADGDRIYAVIRASAVNHDGRSNGIAAPNGQAQERLLHDAYAKAGLSAGQIQYVEAHGTGTVVGDRIELQALAAVLGEGRAPERTCVVGSVKSNIGHTESAAGIAGVIKTALALKHRVLPGNLHFEEPHPALAEAPFPMQVRTTAGPFPFPGETIVAGVSAFSFGGANAHVVLQEPPAARPEPARTEAPLVLPLSAGSHAALRALAAAYVAALRAPDAPALADICMTAAVRRRHHDVRLAVVGHTAEQMAGRLEAFLDGQDYPHVVSGEATASGNGKLAFAFSGQGSHWLGMGRDLYALEPAFRDVIDGCDAVLASAAGWSLREQLHADPDASRLDEIDVVQPAIFAVQAALAALIKTWGVVPDVVFGQSMGEIAAAHTAGILQLDDATRIVLERSRLLRTKRGSGATAVIGLPLGELVGRLSGRLQSIGVAGMTSFTSTLVAGDTPTLRSLIGELEAEGVFCRLIDNIDVPAHSPAMDSLQPQLVAALDGLEPSLASASRFLSTVTLDYEDGPELRAPYWGRNLREPFRVAEAIAQLARDGVGYFLEISPHPVLIGAVRQSLQHTEADGVAVASLVRDEDGPSSLRASLAALWANGYPLAFGPLMPAGARCVSLPSYPWQREHFWVDQVAAVAGGGLTPRSRTGSSLLGAHFAPAHGGAHFWEGEIDGWTLPWLKDHAIRGVPVLPATAYLEMMMAAGQQALGRDVVEVADARFDRMLLLADGEPRQCQVALLREADGGARVDVLSRAAGGDGDWILHATASLKAGAAAGVSGAPAAAPQHREAEMSVDDFYARFRAGGLEYGRAFQGVRALAAAGRSAWAEVRLPEGPDASAAGVHPAVLDAAFQTIAAIAPERADEPRPVYLPRGVARMAVSGRLTGTVRVLAVLSEASRPGDAEIEADVTLFDAGGAARVRVERLRLARVDELAATEPSVADSLHALVWEAMPRTAPTPTRPTGPWLIMGRSMEAQALAARLRQQACEARAVASEDLVHAVQSAGASLAGVVHVGASPGVDLPASVRHGVVDEALTAVRVLSAAGASARLWFVTRDAMGGGGKDESNLADAALWGFGRVVAIEHPEIWGGLCDVGSLPDWEAVAAELLAPDEDREIRLDGGRRYVARLDRLGGPAAAPEPVSLRADAGYLITGGFTGLGLATAHWMAERGARRLVLFGRTALPHRRLWAGIDPSSAQGQRIVAIRALEARGVSVHAAAIDIADEAELTAWLRAYDDEAFPPIRGIVHAAGVVQDALLLRMTDADADAVLQPKVAGSWALHRAAASMPLDFFVFYSSATAVMGQIGQAAYAAANAFEDALAARRRASGLPATSINWGPWASIGLFAQRGLEEHAGLDGVVPLSPAQGFKVLGRLLALDVGQSMVLNVDWARQPRASRLRRLQAQAAPPAAGAGELDLVSLVLMDAPERKLELHKIVGGIVAAVLRFDADKLDHKRALTALGMDSIMAVEIRNRIRRRFDIMPTMVELFTGSVDRLADTLEQALAQDERVAALLDEIESLPPDEVEALLAPNEAAA